MHTRSLTYRTFFYYLPGIITLCLGVVAIHSTLSMIEENQYLEQLHTEHLEEYEELSHDEVEMGEAIQRLKIKDDRAYWSILMLGLSGFLLICINIYQLSRLDKTNKNKKKNLKIMQHRLAAMEATLDGIALIDTGKDISYLNAAFIRMFAMVGQEESDFGSYTWNDIFEATNRKGSQDQVLIDLEVEGEWSDKLTVLMPDGEEQQVELTLKLLDDGGVIATARDITHRIKADSEKKDIQSQLYQAQKMEAIGRLAGGMAHDFNNILAAMNGYAEFLVEDLDKDSPQYGFAENILKAGNQAKVLVDQILAFSRQKSSDIIPMDIMTPVNECVTILAGSMPKRVEIETDFNLKNATIEGNAVQISQVIMNLCVNAKDAIEHGKGKITMTLDEACEDIYERKEWLFPRLPSSQDSPIIDIQDISPTKTELYLGGVVEDMDYACLSIEDTGMGMSRTVLERVFEPFFTTKAVDKGTGLGLSTVHGVITGHRGALKISSTLGKGTRFDLYFPLSRNQPDEHIKEFINKDRHASGRILLVDDQENVREVLSATLRRIGYEVEMTENALMAMEVLRELPDYFDLVVTDQNMPKMTGLEMVHQLHLDIPDLPFILISGYSEQKLQDYLSEHLAIKAVLRKPVQKDILGEEVANVLSKHPRKNLKTA